MSQTWWPHLRLRVECFVMFWNAMIFSLWARHDGHTSCFSRGLFCNVLVGWSCIGDWQPGTHSAVLCCNPVTAASYGRCKRRWHTTYIMTSALLRSATAPTHPHAHTPTPTHTHSHSNTHTPTHTLSLSLSLTHTSDRHLVMQINLDQKSHTCIPSPESSP